MRSRHRIPSVFNLYMVDVLCCALGCVILVWQLDLDKVQDNEKATALAKDEADKLFAATKQDRDAAYLEIEGRKAALAKLEVEAANLKAGLTDRGARIAALEKQLLDSQTRAAALATAVATGEAQLKDARLSADKRAAEMEAARVVLDKKAADLGGKLSEADKRLLELAAQLASGDKRIKELVSVADLVPNLRAQLSATQTKMGDLQKESAERADRLTKATRSLDELKLAHADQLALLKRQSEELTLSRVYEGKWKATQEKLALLEKEANSGKATLTAAERDLATLRGQKLTLESEVVRIRQAADNRFAGITLTGRKVIFLVDMSGSMELVDEKTPAPQKWSEVRNTLLKVMKSLPDLEKFQVIVFEENAGYLLGKGDEWIDYDATTSLPRVEAALKALKPRGGTNMYAALDAAFRYRARGLDTIYLLSDGLPNAGEGVPEAEARRLLDAGREPELSDRLAKHIRKTLKTNWNLEARNERVRINSIGFFYESPDVGAFLWALSRENDGSFVGMSKP